MRKSTKSGRLYLDDLGIEKLNEMMEVLASEDSHLDLSPSKVVSKVLVNFCDKYFQREIKGLRSALFDKKSYLIWAKKKAKTPEEYIELVAKIYDPASKKRTKPSLKPKLEAQKALDEGVQG